MEASPIACIFFCEFHAVAGPKIAYQVPEDYVSKENFDSLSVYLIPKPELQGRLITVNACNMKIIGFPCGIDHQKYSRNRLLFNLCFVFEPTMRTVQYEPIVKKLANYLVHLELECGFIFNESTKAKLPELMTSIKHQLNETRSCILPVKPDQVEDYDVPMFSTKESSIIPSQWDLTTQQVLPFIDGFRHVSKIAAEADVEVSLVKACIQNMIYYGIITLIPIFQYANIYLPTPKMVQLVENIELQEECLQYVALHEAHPPSFRQVFTIYCSMAPGVRFSELYTKFDPSKLGINDRKLIVFGITKGLIRRLEPYPVFPALDPASIPNHRGVYRYFDGSNSYDKICCKMGKSYKEVDESVQKHPSAAVVIWK
ncbi:nitrogen permease regulator 2-like protein [Leptotrombidium deliense]|uniref:Nitrogen permease regulator 2-like protein n=1 Tax=Leptotrombidium deliense TaxID=299467 RepID=A0A443SCG4_9ACAR|nr:nitrogen permease regulator 2-like protein [Leptotrombidium deliense]